MSLEQDPKATQPGTDPPVPGLPHLLQPGLVRLLAPNPSAMTLHGTNSYILGGRNLCIIDPGPDDPAHLAALLHVIDGRTVSHIIVTHSHLDHSALAPHLSQATGAPVLGFGNSASGRSAIMRQVFGSGVATTGEGVDADFAPDQTLPDRAIIATDDWQLQAIHTPGHFGNHLCLRWGNAIFSGDHVMGWASSLVSPPDGDLTDFIASCRKMRSQGAAILYPGHGDPVPDPLARIDWLIAHRAAREAQILAQLQLGPQTVGGLTNTIYIDTPAALHPAAARNVFAHLIDLVGRNLARPEPDLRINARFHPR